MIGPADRKLNRQKSQPNLQLMRFWVQSLFCLNPISIPGAFYLFCQLHKQSHSSYFVPFNSLFWALINRLSLKHVLSAVFSAWRQNSLLQSLNLGKQRLQIKMAAVHHQLHCCTGRRETVHVNHVPLPLPRFLSAARKHSCFSASSSSQEQPQQVFSALLYGTV